MEKRNKKLPKYIQTLIILFVILCSAGYYYYHFIVNANLREVVPAKVYRSAQISDAQFRKIVKKYKIRTVINLRAKKQKDFEKEKLTAEQLGIKFMGMNLSGNRLVTGPELLELIEALKTGETPILIHCKSGIDRAGFASTLAAIAIGHEDFNRAKWQAYVPPGPRKRKNFSKVRADYVHDYAHISDTLKLYEDYCRQKNLNKNDWEQFVQWAIELQPIENINIDYYEPVYGYFPFMGKNNIIIPISKLLKGAYLQFLIQILVVILLIYYTKFCLKSME
ncbi:MAG: tyrosine-protein phosphatase [Sedimentisphaerales bacterium]|nr:tyrosine-protein phosphatase [Sedimentisphaerales bacterium]